MKVKGGGVRDFVPLQREVRQVLDAWLKEREDKIMPLFPRRTGRRMSWDEAAEALRRMAA